MLCIVHKGTAVATRLIVRFLDALQVRIKATMARKRFRQVKADLTVLSIQPGGELRDQTACPSPGLVTMSSRLPFLDESAPSILAIITIIDPQLQNSDVVSSAHDKCVIHEQKKMLNLF